MEGILKAILLGIVQGLTEFLPISSSGHLVIFSYFLNFKGSGLAFDVFLHLGTLFSIFLLFRKELKQMIVSPFYYLTGNLSDEHRYYLRWDFYVILATIPAGIAGVFFKDQIEVLFGSVIVAFLFLFLTGMMMVSIPFLKKQNKEINPVLAITMGFAQAFAILPGVSRSGSTIFSGILLGGEQEKVARFSFIMSIPAVAGAVLLKARDLMIAPPPSSELINIALGTLFSFVFGCLAILWLLNFVKKGKLQWFGYYSIILSITGIVWYFGF
ncbi:MAG: undecaprenyl-diphosphate phosphatase [Calditrichaeota bacterium]|nr:undecaprenyl-diphosphate phosphatase [Calditrichota bacterium]